MTVRTDELLAKVEAFIGYPTWMQKDETQAALRELREEIGRLEEALTEYAEHTSWRCAYRARYKKCLCGLDDTMGQLGLPPVAVNDPEAKKHDGRQVAPGVSRTEGAGESGE